MSTNVHLIEKVVVFVILEFGDDYSQQCLQVSSVIVRQIGVALNVERELGNITVRGCTMAHKYVYVGTCDS